MNDCEDCRMSFVPGANLVECLMRVERCQWVEPIGNRNYCSHPSAMNVARSAQLTVGKKKKYQLDSKLPRKSVRGITLLSNHPSPVLSQAEPESKWAVCLLNATTDLAYFVDKNGYILFWNAALEEYCGLSPEKIKLRPFSDFIFDQDRQLLLDDIIQIFENGNHDNVYRFVGSDGLVTPFYCNANALYNEQGEPEGFVGIGRNICEQLKIQEKLTQSSELLRESQDIAGVGSYVLDVHTGHWESSKLLNKLFGIDKSYKRTVQSWAELIHPEDRDMLVDYFTKEVLGNRKPFNNEYRIIRPSDNAVRWVHGLGRLEFDSQSRPLKMLGTIQDITDRKIAELQLKESELKFQTLADFGKALIWTSGTDKLCDYFNKVWLEFTGRTIEQEIGNGWTEGVHRDDLLHCFDIYVAAFDRRESFGMDYRLRRHDGEFRWIRDEGCPRYNTKGEFIGYIGYCLDITERKLTEAELRIAAIAFESQAGMLVTNAKAEILRVNQAFSKITGYSSEDLIGKNPRILHSGRHDSFFYKTMWENIINTNSWEGEVWNRRKNGEIYPEHLIITAVKNEIGNVTNYVATLTDITLSRNAADEIRHLAFYDVLTRLPNRKLLLDRLQQAFASSMRSNKECALLFIDLDNFKALNDTLGHDVGDLLLQQVAQRLESCVREGDTVARLGGDEFVVMLEDLSESSLEAAAQTEAIGNKVLVSLRQPYQLASHSYHNSPSIGATLFKGQLQSVEEIIKQADIAMYQAKKAGRNTMRFFDPEMQETINARAALEVELRQALANQQLQMYYQVQVDNAHRPTGSEALIRWIHPKRGMLYPNQFIPLAEETGLILHIGQWVLKTACSQLAEWSNQPDLAHLTISVNVSALQFQQDDFADRVMGLLEQTGVNPRRLKLELTESMLIHNVEGIIAKMQRLKAVGVSFSLDDFGTGYSSLSYLSRLPLDQLKIDRSFVMNLEFDADSVAICAATISMAHSLKLKVVAEGVENETQSYILNSVHRCDAMQGYLFGEPVPIEQFETLVRLG